MLMMLPLPCACIARTSCFMLSTTPRTLVSNVAAKLSGVWSVIGPTWPSVAALFITTSRRPNRATVLSTRARTSSSLRTSALINSASDPKDRSSFASALPASSRRPATTTLAPFLANARAAARPMPVRAPVIRTTGVFTVLLHRSCSETARHRRWAWTWRPLANKAKTSYAGDIPYRYGTPMELRHLRYFVAVAEEGSLTNAAERRRHTAQPSLSRQIRGLELEVGVKLRG